MIATLPQAQTKSNSSDTRRTAIRAELEQTRKNFQALVASVSKHEWQHKSPTTEWTVGELLEHLTWAVEYLPKEIESARKNQGMFNYPKLIADPYSYWSTRWSARSSTPESLARRYAAAIEATLRVLETVSDGEWERGANFYGEGFYSVKDLFHTPAEHFADHTAGMKQVLPSK